MDTNTEKLIALLHPFVREEMKKIINECDKALNGRAKIRITQSLRTFEAQDALYQRGRTKPGKKVTNAKAGESIHNYGFAVDICLIINQKEASWDIDKDWDNDRKADWIECVEIFAKYGWNWGGNWKTFKDFPHFEKQKFSNWRKLALLERDSNGYVKI